ncbi:MAG: RNA polymerase sigma factor [Cyclobacteriaceae bacterium]
MRDSNQIFDELLVLNAQDGDGRAFEMLISRWAKKVHQQIFWMTRDHELANDLSQDCWIAVSKTLRKLSDPNKFGSWVLRIAHNKTMDHLRKRQNKIRLEPILASTESPEINEENDREVMFKSLNIGLGQLDELHKSVIKMYYLNSLSVIQISEVLKIPTGTVKSRLFKAREKLKEIIQQNNVNHEK